MLAMEKITVTKSVRFPLLVPVGGGVATSQEPRIPPSAANYRPMFATELIESIQQLLGDGIPQTARIQSMPVPYQPYPGGMSLALAWEEELPAAAI